MKTILVPTDFSASAKNALKYAIAIAKQTNTKLTILHVYHVAITTGKLPHILNPKLVKESVRIAYQKLKELEENIEELKNVEYRIETTPMHWVVEFPEIIKAQNADLTVMGTNGARGLKK